MLRLVYIVLLSLCSFIFGQGVVVATNNSEQHSVAEVVANRFTQQLECAHRCNNSAERTHSITVPATTTTVSGTRVQHRVDMCAVPQVAVGAKVNFSIRFSLYRICCKRVIDYYLYTLCCLRL